MVLKLSQSSKGYLLIAISGFLFGCTGIFVNSLSASNISINIINFYRPFISFIILFIYLILRHREYLKVDRKGLLTMALLGFFSQTLSNTFYFYAIEKTSMATAVVLLYSFPVFVTIIARILYKELLSIPKVIALVISLIGCFLTATGGALDVLKLNNLGLLFGLGAGFSFSLVAIISKSLVTKYNQLVIVCYTMGFGTLFSFLFFNPRELFLIEYNMSILLNLFAIGFFVLTLGYLFYTTGMSYKIQSSKASIVMTIEVPVAVLASFIFFSENILGLKLLGIVLVILSVILVEYGEKLMNKYKQNIKLGKTS